MISQTVFNYFYTILALGILIPIIVSAVFLVVKKEKITTVLAGAATFFISAVILESIPKALLYQIPGPVSTYLVSHPWLYIIVGAALAGIFEETGRFILFKFVLKNRNSRTTSIAAGLGHGLFEVMYLFVLQSIQCIMYAFMINAGTFNALIEQTAAASPETAEALSVIPKQLETVTFATLPLSLIERCGAVLFHVGASMLVFYAVKKAGRSWAYPLAILLHTLLDVFAGLGQLGILTNVYAIEAVIITCGIAMFAGCYVLAYKKLPETDETAVNEAPETEV